MHAVTSCHRLSQSSVNIGQRDRQTIVFHLAAHLEVLAGQTFLHALIPVGHILFVIGVGE